MQEMRVVKLISSVYQLADNVRRYNKSAAKFANLMPYNRAWYALRTKDGWLLGPSKFVGYDISPEEYLGSAYSTEKHGRVCATERRCLSMVASPKASSSDGQPWWNRGTPTTTTCIRR